MRDSTLVDSTLVMTVMLALLGCAGCSQDGNPAALSATAPELDASPPAVPTGLTATAGRGVVKLDWSPNTTDVDFLAFNVYRVVDGRRYLLTPAPTTADAFIDRDPWQGDCRYAVAALDTAGNQSGLTVTVYERRPSTPGRGQM